MQNVFWNFLDFLPAPTADTAVAHRRCVTQIVANSTVCDVAEFARIRALQTPNSCEFGYKSHSRTNLNQAEFLEEIVAPSRRHAYVKAKLDQGFAEPFPAKEAGTAFDPRCVMRRLSPLLILLALWTIADARFASLTAEPDDDDVAIGDSLYLASSTPAVRTEAPARPGYPEPARCAGLFQPICFTPPSETTRGANVAALRNGKERRGI